MIELFIVHNHEEERLSYLKPIVERIIEESQDSIRVKYSEKNYYSEPSSLDLVFRHIKLKIVRLWLHISLYKLTELSITKSQIKAVFNILKTKQMSRSKAMSEIDVTSKHLYAWRSFSNSDSRHLVVLESDAIIESIPSFVKFIVNLKQFSADHFITLSYPFKFTDLGIPEKNVRYCDNHIEIGLQISNTAAGYVLSKKLATEMYDICKKQNPKRQVIIDWLINECFLKLNRKEDYAGRRLTILPLQELVRNGSIVGEYESRLQK